MKNLISTATTVIISTVLGGGATYVVVTNTTTTYVNETVTTTTTTNNNSSIRVNTNNEKDDYVIHWTGKKGANFTGSSITTYPDGSLPKTYLVTKTLPHTIKFSAIKNTVVYATAAQPGVKVLIIKNGEECGVKTIEGNVIGDNKVCT